jgi:hypothetical protein
MPLGEEYACQAEALQLVSDLTLGQSWQGSDDLTQG